MTDTPEFLAAAEKMIREINSELVEARHAYYVLAQPVMTDPQYDALEKQLAEMVKTVPQFRHLAPVLTSVGSDVTHQSGRIRHRTPMLSIENKYDFDALREWCEQFPGQQFVIEPKVDGASCSLHYLDRKLIKAVTRGDGQYGEDVTRQMAASGAVPLTLPEEFFPETLVEIRGEVFIRLGQFEKLNKELEAAGEKPYASPRNLAAGSMKLLDLEVVKHRGLKFFVWQVDGVPDSYLAKRSLNNEFAHHGILYVTRLLGFPAAITSMIGDVDNLIAFIDTTVRKERETLWREGLGMETDGVVIKLANPQARRDAGVGSKVINWGCSFKFPSEQKGTVLRDVVWQTGRTGNLTPVAVLDPINLGGAVVTRCNLNNWSFIEQLGIEIGDEVACKRGGEVIPVCSGVSRKSPTATPIPEPTACQCGQALVKTINPKSGVVTHWCESPLCTERLKARLGYLADRTVLELDELGPELIRQLVDDEYVLTLADLFSFADAITKGMVQKPEAVQSKVAAMGYGVKVIKMAAAVEKAKTTTWDKWIAALDLPGIGRTLGKVIATQARLQSDDMQYLYSKLVKLFTEEKIEGVGDIRKAEVLGFLQRNLDTFTEDLRRLHELGVRPEALIQAQQEGDLPLSGYVLCVTGDCGEDRESIYKKLTELGAQMKTGVSKKLTHLIVGNAPGKSKLLKATELNLPRLNVQWLKSTLEQNGMALEVGEFAPEWDDL